MQEEIRRSTRDGSSSKHDDEENLALSSKARKGKGKVSHSKSSSSHGVKKIDKSKVRCFNCHEVGHYATNFPLNKSKKTTLGKASAKNPAICIIIQVEISQDYTKI